MEGGGGTAVASPQSSQGFFHRPRLPYREKNQFYKHHHYYNRMLGEQGPNNATNFDGKRMRKSITRKTVDYNSSVIKLLESRVWQRDSRDVRWIQPDPTYSHELSLPETYLHNPINAVTTRFVRTSTNKIRCPIFCCVWTPEGRRLVTGASSGEFTLWNGLTFNFETILQAHDYPVRAMTWSHNDLWLLTGDHLGYIKYWQSNMNNVKMYQAHKDQPIRGASFSPTDSKITTCADDGTVRIFDFVRCYEERVLRGHGAEVKCVDWHPQKGLVVSGSKDSQQPIKLWDPRSSNPLATLHAHKSTVMAVRFNQNGNWLLTASRDHVCKLFDIRTMKEMYTFRGHKKEATAISWHPIHETMFASGGSDGSLLFWEVGNEKEVASVETAHDSIVWSLAWHPLGHILASASNDHTTKFWTRNRPGDRMRDRYNLNMLPIGTSEEMLEFDDDTSALPSIPGMGLEHGLPEHLKKPEEGLTEDDISLDTSIPGLESSVEELAKLKPQPQRKVPYAKPIPADFQRQWDKTKAPGIAPQQTETSQDEDAGKKEAKDSEDDEAKKMERMVKNSGVAVAQAHQAVLNAMKNAKENGGQLPLSGMMMGQPHPGGPPVMGPMPGMGMDGHSGMGGPAGRGRPPGGSGPEGMNPNEGAFNPGPRGMPAPNQPGTGSKGKAGIPALMGIRLNGPSSRVPGNGGPPEVGVMDVPPPNLPKEMMDAPEGRTLGQDFLPHSPPLPLPSDNTDFPTASGKDRNRRDFSDPRDEDLRGDIDLRQGFTDVDMRQQFHDPPPPKRFDGRFDRGESPPGGWGNRMPPRDGLHQDFDMRQQRGPHGGARMGPRGDDPRDPPFDDLRHSRSEDRPDLDALRRREGSPGGRRREDFMDEDLRQPPGRFLGGGPPGSRSWRGGDSSEEDPFRGFDPGQDPGPSRGSFPDRGGFGSQDEDMRGGTRSRFGLDEPFDPDFRPKGLLPHPGDDGPRKPRSLPLLGDRDDRANYPDLGSPHDSGDMKRTWNEGPGDGRDMDQLEPFGNFGGPGGPGRGQGNMWRGGRGDIRGGGPGMRGRGDPSMRGRGDPGMRGSPSGFRGPFRGGMGRGGMGRGGMGRGGPGW
ncbi:pre-mRNA 3' end processing protein WDR33-like [Acanthaster planci]|uniref:pre-mRNA 3' end processing protein WDR33 n=1 Tax=Acanthaster planci TaxID=133434 RepID=A0A8B7ZV24_ACAPL|nr:pre-mRNA 3' end processing protein WDR33-like [Acanthaster planci]